MQQLVNKFFSAPSSGEQNLIHSSNDMKVMDNSHSTQIEEIFTQSNITQYGLLNAIYAPEIPLASPESKGDFESFLVPPFFKGGQGGSPRILVLHRDVCTPQPLGRGVPGRSVLSEPYWNRVMFFMKLIFQYKFEIFIRLLN